jgi:hypothetical protein
MFFIAARLARVAGGAATGHARSNERRKIAPPKEQIRLFECLFV